ncbi:aminotransferase class I/II-fold pyridoxal phosphate-dependent enzyme [Aerococcaceae bacterium DSM 111020]|nr:aminotransferase class I/II-fold pyridoxal phosphate-dependent enzyme [Aerococcaceae bacterium DSM 111020]
MNYSNLNKAAQAAPPNLIRAFGEKINHIEGLLTFNLGEPDFPTPEIVKQATIQSIEQDQSFYAHSRGVMALREEVARYIQRKFNVSYDPASEILITIGSTEGLKTAVDLVTEPGDNILVVDPNYVIYNTQITLAQGNIIPIDVQDASFKLTPQAIHDKMAEIGEAKAIIFNYPTNPTGVSYSREELKALAEVFTEYDLYIISDEVYSVFNYGEEPHVSIAEFARERTLLINGASKAFAMTGWRTAFLAAPKPLIDVGFAVHQSMITAAPTQIQYGAIAAYRDLDEEVEAMRQSYLQRRNLMMDGLDNLGIQYIKPDGAFYIMIKVPEWFDGTDQDFCLQIAEEQKVALTPGSVFGEAGKQHVRISYASSEENLKILLQRLADFKTNYLKQEP